MQNQKNERMSDKSMELYINVDKESKNNSKINMPEIETPVIKLHSQIPEDEDFGL